LTTSRIELFAEKLQKSIKYDFGKDPRLYANTTKLEIWDFGGKELRISFTLQDFCSMNNLIFIIFPLLA